VLLQASNFKVTKEDLAEVKQRLLERLEVVQAREEIDQALAVQQATVSVNAECLKYHRYRLESERGAQASLRLLHQLQRMRLNYGEELGATAEAPEPGSSGGDSRPNPGVAAAGQPPSLPAGEAVDGNEAGATQVAGGPAGSRESGTVTVVNFTIGRPVPTSEREADRSSRPCRGGQGDSEVRRE
jgi:hypothetical protein